MLKKVAVFLLLISFARADLGSLKTEISVHKDYKDLNQSGWETKIQYRAVHVKYDEDLQRAIDGYVRKIPLIREQITQHIIEGDTWHAGKRKLDLDRLLDKLACCLEEQTLRKDGSVTRTPHHTDYFIDYVNGSDGNTGLSIAQHWKTITQYTTTTVRSAGDRAFLRANTTWAQGTEAVDITFDEDGTIDAYIELIGADSVTNDPWSDSSDVKPIIDFEDGSFQCTFLSDDYWKLTLLDIRQSADGSGLVQVNVSRIIVFVDCVFRDNASATVEGLRIIGSSVVKVSGCSFSDTDGAAIQTSAGSSCSITNNTIIDAGSIVGATIGLDALSGGMIDIIDSTIAVTNAFDTASVKATSNGRIRMRNVTFGTETYSIATDGRVFSEDNDATFEEHIRKFAVGDIERDTGTVRGGGADSSAKITPNSGCGPNDPIILGDRFSGFSRIWAANGSYTATVYVRVGTAWDSALTSSEVYMTTSELDNAGNATRVERTSTETINNAGSWTALTTSITPARTGWIYFWVYLVEFEDATEHIFVDIKPTVI